MVVIFVVISCDPTSLMDANITNNTTQNLSLIFYETSRPNDSLKLEPDQTKLFQDGFSSTGGFLEPSLIQFDSIHIQNASNEILKTFKKNMEGKNIYNVDEFWLFSEPSEREYYYEYIINNPDIE